jgi:HSP20 family protein
MSRWDPFNEALSLRDAMNHLYENAVLQPSWWDGGQHRGSEGFAPAMDVRETQDDYLVEVNLPGVKPEDVDVEFHQGVLTIKGEMKSEEPAGRQAGQQGGQQSGGQRHNYSVRERRWGRFFRSVTLPTNIDANKVQANFEHGVLTLTIPKAEETKARKIQVQSTGRPQQIEAGNGAKKPSGTPA